MYNKYATNTKVKLIKDQNLNVADLGLIEFL